MSLLQVAGYCEENCLPCRIRKAETAVIDRAIEWAASPGVAGDTASYPKAVRELFRAVRQYQIVEEEAFDRDSSE
jgi:hypothetical protein